MRTFHLRGGEKPALSKWPRSEGSLRQPIRTFLFQDLIPSLIILMILGFCTSIVAEKIYQAKAAQAVDSSEQGLHR
jgi:hypothetical protein